jgi:hypothetical protein
MVAMGDVPGYGGRNARARRGERFVYYNEVVAQRVHFCEVDLHVVTLRDAPNTLIVCIPKHENNLNFYFCSGLYPYP